MITKELVYKRYLEWIETNINPTRVRLGFPPMTEEQSLECFNIMWDFQEKWSREKFH